MSRVLSESELAAIRERHPKVTLSDEDGTVRHVLCGTDGRDWPCDTIALHDHIDALTKRLRAISAARESWHSSPPGSRQRSDAEFLIERMGDMADEYAATATAEEGRAG